MSERITIVIETSNAAFDDEPSTELALILEHVARRFRHGELQDGARLIDSNGNTCGHVKIMGKL